MICFARKRNYPTLSTFSTAACLTILQLCASPITNLHQSLQIPNTYKYIYASSSSYIIFSNYTHIITYNNDNNSNNVYKKMGICKMQTRNELGQKKRAPKGHIAVYVGEEMCRFVVPISFLKNPQFQRLLNEAAQVYGFQSNGGIMLPCSPSTFLRVVELI